LPFSLNFQNKLGTCYLALNNVEEAKKVFEFIVSQNSDYVSAHTNLGYIYMQQNNASLAFGHLSQAHNLDPDHEQTLINMAVWYHSKNINQEARKCLLQLLAKHPQNAQAKAMLSDLEH